MPEWTDDCQEKKNYDFPILEISSRYWPRGGGFTVFNNSPGKPVRFEENEDRPSIRPSATCHVILHLSEGDAESEDGGLRLVDADFEGETEQEVKDKVEAFAAEQWRKAVGAIKRAFYVDPNGSPN